MHKKTANLHSNDRLLFPVSSGIGWGMMMKTLSRTFKSLKPRNNFGDFGSKPLKEPPKSLKLTSKSSSSSLNSPEVSPSNTRPLEKNPWYVYLILSTKPPFKTYVGVTTNFSRRYISPLIFSFIHWWIQSFWATKYYWFKTSGDYVYWYILLASESGIKNES